MMQGAHTRTAPHTPPPPHCCFAELAIHERGFATLPLEFANTVPRIWQRFTQALLGACSHAPERLCGMPTLRKGWPGLVRCAAWLCGSSKRQHSQAQNANAHASCAGSSGQRASIATPVWQCSAGKCGPGNPVRELTTNQRNNRVPQSAGEEGSDLEPKASQVCGEPVQESPLCHLMQRHPGAVVSYFRAHSLASFGVPASDAPLSMGPPDECCPGSSCDAPPGSGPEAPPDSLAALASSCRLLGGEGEHQHE